MKAIVTHYIGATNTKPSRIKATAEGGHSVTISYPHEADGDRAHWLAAEALRKKLKWTGEMVAGGLPNGDVAFVFTEYGSSGKTERFNPSRRPGAARKRTPAQRAATARMLAARKKHNTLRRAVSAARAKSQPEYDAAYAHIRAGKMDSHIKKNPTARMDANGWREECNYISRVMDKGGRVREMNNDPATFRRYCEMQKRAAERDGFHDAALYIQEIIDDLPKTNPARRKVVKLRVLTHKYKIQVKRGAMWRTLESFASKDAAVTRGKELSERSPRARMRVFWK